MHCKPKIIQLLLLFIFLLPIALNAAVPTATVTRTITPVLAVYFQMTATPTLKEIRDLKTNVYGINNFGGNFNMCFDVWGMKDVSAYDCLLLLYCPVNKTVTAKARITNALAVWQNKHTLTSLKYITDFNDADFKRVYAKVTSTAGAK
jgi:hypothetical protein